MGVNFETLFIEMDVFVSSQTMLSSGEDYDETQPVRRLFLQADLNFHGLAIAICGAFSVWLDFDYYTQIDSGFFSFLPRKADTVFRYRIPEILKDQLADKGYDGDLYDSRTQTLREWYAGSDSMSACAYDHFHFFSRELDAAIIFRKAVKYGDMKVEMSCLSGRGMHVSPSRDKYYEMTKAQYMNDIYNPNYEAIHSRVGKSFTQIPFNPYQATMDIDYRLWNSDLDTGIERRLSANSFYYSEPDLLPVPKKMEPILSSRDGPLNVILGIK